MNGACHMEHGPLGALIFNLANISQSVFCPQCKGKQIKGLLRWVFLYWVRRLPGGGGESDHVDRKVSEFKQAKPNSSKASERQYGLVCCQFK